MSSDVLSSTSIPTSAIVIKPPSMPPKLPAQKKDREAILRRIDIYHPAYDDLDPLLTLRASDNGGVHYNVAYYACCILAGNLWKENEGRSTRSSIPSAAQVLATNETSDRSHSNELEVTNSLTDEELSTLRQHATPFFSLTGDPSEPITIPADDILREDTYYFHICSHPGHYRYPIVPNFAHWEFPETIPKPWSSLKFPSVDELCDPSRKGGLVNDPTLKDSTLGSSGDAIASLKHNEVCRVTASFNSVEQAHVINGACNKWFKANRMRKFALSVSDNVDAIDDYPNIIPLRSDIHRVFDFNHITFFPKPDPRDDNKYKLVTHMLHTPGKATTGNLEVLTKYQNRELLPPHGVPGEYLFARFAWSIFTDASYPLVKDKSQTFFFRVLQRQVGKPRKAVFRDSKSIPFRKSQPKDEGSTNAGTKRTNSNVEDHTGLPEGDVVDGDADFISIWSDASDKPFDYAPSPFGSDSDVDERHYKRVRSLSEELNASASSADEVEGLVDPIPDLSLSTSTLFSSTSSVHRVKPSKIVPTTVHDTNVNKFS
ncbi:hypothetical protein F4776DRAFT_669576 [Hypoxylon sp. NC0597]|nr:hypothetical protein F4776DRAFT_669576 [Hypoxylon sp. NC0597]